MITTEVILTCKENFKKQINSLRESNKNLHLSELSREWEELLAGLVDPEDTRFSKICCRF